jgi:hypothetical protein
MPLGLECTIPEDWFWRPQAVAPSGYFEPIGWPRRAEFCRKYLGFSSGDDASLKLKPN